MEKKQKTCQKDQFLLVQYIPSLPIPANVI